MPHVAAPANKRNLFLLEVKNDDEGFPPNVDLSISLPGDTPFTVKIALADYPQSETDESLTVSTVSFRVSPISLSFCSYLKCECSKSFRKSWTRICHTEEALCRVSIRLPALESRYLILVVPTVFGVAGDVNVYAFSDTIYS